MGAAGHLHTYLRLRWLHTRTLFVRKGGHRLGELHEDLTFHLSEPHAFPTAGAARAPGIHYETRTETQC